MHEEHDKLRRFESNPSPRLRGIAVHESLNFIKRRTIWTDLAIGIVLLAATMHCVQCIFFDNVSYLDLHRFAYGQENMPFQGRVAMMPLLRWGEHRYGAMIASLPHGVKWGFEFPSTGKTTSYKAGLVSLFLLVLFCVRHGFRNGRKLWWLCPSLALLTFYIGYGARADQNWWYPYDLPHAVLFTAQCLFLLEGKWLWMAACFLLDTPMRETSVYLLPCLLAVGWVRNKRIEALAYAAAMGAFWLAVHILIARRFKANPRDIGIHRLHFYLMFHYLRYWPQIFSVFGFLWLPLVVLRDRLKRDETAFLAGAIPGLLTTAVFGIWYETRVWSEWNGVVACLVFSAGARALETYSLPLKNKPAFAAD